MVQYLPKSGFKWVKDVNEPGFYNVPNDSPIGFLLEVSLSCPPELSEKFSDLPLCPEHRAPPGSKQKKLLTTLFDKKKYVIHYRALKQALKHGMVLDKIHRAVQFKQEPWLAKYVNLNTEKRTQAKNEFEKMFFKLMVNAVFGEYCLGKKYFNELLTKFSNYITFYRENDGECKEPC